MASRHPLPYQAPRPPTDVTKPVASADHSVPPQQPFGPLSENSSFSCWPPTNKNEDDDDGDDDGDRRTTHSFAKYLEIPSCGSVFVPSKVSFLLS